MGSSAKRAPGTSRSVSRETSSTDVSAAEGTSPGVGSTISATAAASPVASDGSAGDRVAAGRLDAAAGRLAGFAAALGASLAVTVEASAASGASAGSAAALARALADRVAVPRPADFLGTGARSASLLIPAPRRLPPARPGATSSLAAAKNRSTGLPARDPCAVSVVSEASAVLGINAPRPRPKPRRFSVMGKSFPYAHSKRHGLIVRVFYGSPAGSSGNPEGGV